METERTNHQWTDEERDYIRVHYAGTNQSAADIATYLGVTVNAVKGQVQKLGVQKNTDYRKEWTKADEKLLRELVQTHCVRNIALTMNRGVGSITNKIKRLRLSRRYRTGWYTKREVCEILGQDHKWVQRRIDKRNLKATFHDGKRPTSKGMRRWHINELDLANFIRRHARELNSRTVDLPEIVYLLDIPRERNGNNKKWQRGGARYPKKLNYSGEGTTEEIFASQWKYENE